MEEMLEDTLDMDEDEELEEEADEEVDKVLFDLTNGKLGEAGSARTDLPVSRHLIILECTLTLVIVLGRQATGRGDGENDGEVPTAVGRIIEWLIGGRGCS